MMSITALPHTLEIYLPDRYVDDSSGKLWTFSETFWNGLKSEIIDILMGVENCSGLSLRTEQGIYRHPDAGICEMNNTVIKMHTVESLDDEFINNIVFEIKNKFHQKEILIKKDGVAYLYY